jgi:hypothetical protein
MAVHRPLLLLNDKPLFGSHLELLKRRRLRKLWIIAVAVQNRQSVTQGAGGSDEFLLTNNIVLLDYGFL